MPKSRAARIVATARLLPQTPLIGLCLALSAVGLGPGQLERTAP